MPLIAWWLVRKLQLKSLLLPKELRAENLLWQLASHSSASLWKMEKARRRLYVCRLCKKWFSTHTADIRNPGICETVLRVFMAKWLLVSIVRHLHVEHCSVKLFNFCIEQRLFHRIFYQSLHSPNQRLVLCDVQVVHFIEVLDLLYFLRVLFKLSVILHFNVTGDEASVSTCYWAVNSVGIEMTSNFAFRLDARFGNFGLRVKETNSVIIGLDSCMFHRWNRNFYVYLCWNIALYVSCCWVYKWSWISQDVIKRAF